MTVSMPVSPRSDPDLLRRAVDAVLGQTHGDLRLVVVGDGPGAPLSALDDITDERLIRFHLAANRGRYFADAVTLAACGTPWWTIHDDDDEAAPEWLEKMLAAAGDTADVVLTAQRVIGIHVPEVIEPVVPWQGRDLAHHAHMAGLWRTSYLRAVGGPHPRYRVGWDTIMTGTPMIPGLADVRVVDVPLYTRYRRYGSLTTAPETGMRSRVRLRCITHMRALWPKIIDAAGGGAAAVGAVITATVDRELAGEVAVNARRLRRAITVRAAPAAVRAPRPEPARPVHVPDGVWPLLTDQSLWAGGWPLDRGSAAELVGRLAARAPGVVVECGSGSSTLLLGEWAKATGARVVSLEHDERWARRTRAALASRGLAGHVDVRHAPLIQTDTGPWYDTDLPDGIDLALIDGPPMATGGRAATLPHLLPHMAAGWEAILNDADRPGEQAALAAWQRDHGVHVTGCGPLALVTGSPVVWPDVDASDVVVTLLTGARPGLLDATLTALRDRAPRLLDTAHVIAMHNGGDPDTGDVLDGLGALVDQTIRTQRVQPIGESVRCLAAAASATGRNLWLHLEDDWQCSTFTPGWLDQARAVLDGDQRISQVRLRHHRDTVLARHMVTGRPIRWTPDTTRGCLAAADAHWTFNPSLVRTRAVAPMLKRPGLTGEGRAQVWAHARNLRSAAQLVPGVFEHAGDDESLRAQTEKRRP